MASLEDIKIELNCEIDLSVTSVNGVKFAQFNVEKGDWSMIKSLTKDEIRQIISTLHSCL